VVLYRHGDQQARQQAERPAGRLRDGEFGPHDPGKQPDREPVRPQCLLGAPVRTAGQDFNRTALLAASIAPLSHFPASFDAGFWDSL
jgi:hypothetical protein